MSHKSDDLKEQAQQVETETQDETIDSSAQEQGNPDPQAAKIAELEAELVSLKDQLLRAYAENENIRKRARIESDDAKKFAVTQFARDILTVNDNLNRALIAMEQNASPEVKPLIDGVAMTEKEMVKVLEKHHIKKIYPLHETFDPKFHEAMFETDHDQHAAGTITEVLQAGYVLNERLLRPAKVGVVRG